jgi:mRNA-degrading endonuclease RelE of RelBE toxin-antitoxin system
MSGYIARFHPGFFDDIKKLDRKEREILQKQVNKVKENPRRFKRLHGRDNCYRIRIGNLRIVYYLKGRVIWFLVAEKRKTVYSIYFSRLYKIRQKLE